RPPAPHTGRRCPHPRSPHPPRLEACCIRSNPLHGRKTTRANRRLGQAKRRPKAASAFPSCVGSALTLDPTYNVRGRKTTHPDATAVVSAGAKCDPRPAWLQCRKRGTSMYARVATFKGDPARLPELWAKIEEMGPRAKALPGMVDAYAAWRGDGQGVVVALYRSKEDADRAVARIQALGGDLAGRVSG